MTETPRTDELLRESMERLKSATGDDSIRSEMNRLVKRLVNLCKDLEEGNGLLRMFIHEMVDKSKKPGT